jgi:hypothetical protein
MKPFLLAIAVFALIVLENPNLSAQVHDLDARQDQDKYNLKWQRYFEYLEKTNPYDNPIMHYQFSRKPSHAYPYPPCCISTWQGSAPYWYMNGGPTRRTPETVKNK